jgi:hypothetical protein
MYAHIHIYVCLPVLVPVFVAIAEVVIDELHIYTYNNDCNNTLMSFVRPLLGLKWQKLDERRLRLAFDRLDHNNSGFITLENLQVIDTLYYY